MPELPEVETIARDLADELDGQLFVGSELLWVKSVNVSQVVLNKKLAKQRVVSVYRLGKSLVIALANDQYLHFHLKMTGQLVWQSEDVVLAGGHPIIGVGTALPNKFTRAIFRFSSGQLFFNDVRKFGWIKLLTADELELYGVGLGLEPTVKEFTFKMFLSVMQNRKTKLKALLLDQSVVVGLGNIYVDEVLFQAGLRPDRQANTLDNDDWRRLYKAIKKVLTAAIKYRGTSFSDYRDGRGQKGNFVSHLQVYGRAKLSCLRCGRVITKTRLAGRGTHWCLNCQK